MALFQRQPVRDELIVPYTISFGKQETLLIVGLGNPEDKYKSTRHNIGFEAVDEIAKQHGFDNFVLKKDFNALLSQQVLGGNKIILIKPQTYMNLSGQSVRAVMDYYKITPSNTVAIHDELAIPFGQIRMRIGGQSAGHNGVASVIEHCGADFGRIRVGIKNSLVPKNDTSEFVLKKFSKEELSNIPTLLNEINVIATEFMFSNQLPHDTRSIII
jgi:peptidyl-tRNA hydrolase, PTH1 family